MPDILITPGSGNIRFSQATTDSSANISISGNNLNVSSTSGSINISAPSGLRVNNTLVSLSGHAHTANDITDFNSRVSGLLPLINNSGNKRLLTSNGSINGIVAESKLLFEESGPIAHLQLRGNGNVISFDEDLLTVIGTDGNDLYISANRFYTTVGNGMTSFEVNSQGIYYNNYLVSVSGHQHNTSSIINFNSGVSGLLPVKNITSGSGINVFNSDGIYTIAVTGNFGLTSEEVDDRVSGLLSAGTGITLNYDDLNNILTISTSGLAFTSGANFNSLSVTGVPVSISGHKHTYTDITNFNSGVQDSLSTTLLGGSFINLNYDSTLDTLTISSSGLQPSGNYSIVGHSHIVSDITNFSSGVNGLVSGIYAPLNSPNFSGIPTVPTASTGTNTTQVASTAFVRNEISNLVGSAPSTLDTLNELASALGNDANFSTTITNNLAGKANLSGATFTGSISGPSGNFNNLQQNGVGVSVSGHSHTSGDITNFNTAASAAAPVQSVAGKTGAITLTKNDVGLSNVDNTTDLDKPISSATQTALNGKAAALHAHGAIDPFGAIGEAFVVAPSSVSAPVVVGSNGAVLRGQFGSGAGTICQGNDSRLSDARQPLSHYHGYITNDGQIGSLSGQLVITTTSGLLTTISGIPSSQITDFNSSVSGLLPVTNIVSGTGISIFSSSGIYTINSTINAVAEAGSLVTTVFNKTDSTINKGSVVYINGGQGDQPTIQLAIGANEGGSSKTYGIVQNNIPSMSLGKVVVAGALTGLDTDVYNPTAPVGNVNGITLWLSPTISGAMTTTKPYAPYHMVSVGTIIRTHQNEGVIEVRIQNGFELEELHNVAISGVNNGQFLQYNSSSGLWVPSSSGNFSTLQVNGTGVSINGHTHNSSDIIDFNSSVSGLLPVTNIIGGTNISIIPSGSIYTVSVSGQLGLTAEEVDDRINNLLAAGTGIDLNYDDDNNILTINTSGLQPAGNYAQIYTGDPYASEADNSFVDRSLSLWDMANGSVGLLINDNNVYLGSYLGSSTSNDVRQAFRDVLELGSASLANSGIFAPSNNPNFSGTLSVSGIPLAEIIDDEVAGLLVAGSGINLNYSDVSNTLTVDTNVTTSLVAGTGIALVYNTTTDELSINTSGVSLTGHTHISSNITDFNSSVSGIVSGVYAPLNNPNFSGTINISGVSLNEIIDDEVAALLVAGTGMVLNYNDNSNTLTMNTSTNIINSSNLYLWANFR